MRIAVNEIQVSEPKNVASAQMTGMRAGDEVERAPGISVLPAGERATPGKEKVTLCKTPSITKVKVVALDMA